MQISLGTCPARVPVTYSHVRVQVKKTKPEPRVCPVCGDKVGISLQSLSVHLRTKHGDAYAEYEHLFSSCESPK
jgi:atypical dual specificity phosphatase